VIFDPRLPAVGPGKSRPQDRPCTRGLVLAVADDPGMHSSQNEQASRFYADSGAT